MIPLGFSLGRAGPGAVLVFGVWLDGRFYSFVAQMVTLDNGCEPVLGREPPLEENLPPKFARLHAVHKTPASAAIVTGIVTTVVIVIYGFLAADAEDLFWTLFAFSSIVFLIPYLIMFAAFLRLRSIDSVTPRPYRVPGGNVGAWAFAILCILFILQAIIFFIYTPGEFDLNYAGSVIVGVLVTILIGEGLIRRAERKFAG